MNPNQELWEKGDFTRIAELMRSSGEAFAASLAPPPAARVLDLGCGDGTTAIPLAQLGANVTGIDIARNLVEAGRRRAQAMGLDNIDFAEGDACHLHEIDDHSFDLSVTVFGAMFAPKPHEVAAELVRVTRPGGKIVMGNWIPNDPTSFVSQLLRISASYLPAPPPGFISPMTWGVESQVQERFAAAGVPAQRVSMHKDVFHFVAVDQEPEAVIELFRHYYGPTMNAFDAASKQGRDGELLAQLVDLAKTHNQAGDGGTRIPATFLRVVAQV